MESQADEVVTCSSSQHNGRLQRHGQKHPAAAGIAAQHRPLPNPGSAPPPMPLAVSRDQEFGKEEFVIS